MKDVSVNFSYDLTDVDDADWIDAVDDISEEFGHFEPVGADHSAAFIDAGRMLLVTFEAAPSVQDTAPDRAPLGWSFVSSNGWSSLTVLSHNTQDWFRSPAVYGYFDRMIDDGFFDDFDAVLFYGAGPAGHAAAAFSIASPDAKVVLVQPQATLDTALAGWDRRFPRARRLDFTSRYGFAPRMVETASDVWVIHDPLILEDAVHAAMFNGENTSHFTTPHLGPDADDSLKRMEALPHLITQAMDGTLDRMSFAKQWRKRRDLLRYGRSILYTLDEAGRHPKLLARLCRHMSNGGKRPVFTKKLAELEAEGVHI